MAKTAAVRLTRLRGRALRHAQNAEFRWLGGELHSRGEGDAVRDDHEVRRLPNLSTGARRQSITACRNAGEGKLACRRCRSRVGTVPRGRLELDDGPANGFSRLVTQRTAPGRYAKNQRRRDQRGQQEERDEAEQPNAAFTICHSPIRSCQFALRRTDSRGQRVERKLASGNCSLVPLAIPTLLTPRAIVRTRHGSREVARRWLGPRRASPYHKARFSPPAPGSQCRTGVRAGSVRGRALFPDSKSSAVSDAS